MTELANSGIYSSMVKSAKAGVKGSNPKPKARWKPPHFDEVRFYALVKSQPMSAWAASRMRKNRPNPLERLVRRGCSEDVLVGALQEIAVAESIPANRREALLRLGFSEKVLRSQAKRLHQDADFLRRLLDSPIISPPLGGAAEMLDFHLLLVNARNALNTLARWLNLDSEDRRIGKVWLPDKYFQTIHDLPRAALARYVRMTTGKPHFREVADILNAALEASQVPMQYSPDAIRKAEQRADPRLTDHLIQHWHESHGYHEICWSDPVEEPPKSGPWCQPSTTS